MPLRTQFSLFLDSMTCTPGDPVCTAARLILQHHCRALPIVDGPETRRPVGLITDRAIVYRVAEEGLDAMRLPVRDMMTLDPTRVPIAVTIAECAHLLEEGREELVLIVVDGGGRVVGTVAQAPPAPH